jgi:hypothetical protein
MRLAVAPAGQLNDPMLLRVPPASLKTLGKYGNDLALKGVEPHFVVTRIGFDYTVSHPSLTFKPIGFITEDMLPVIEETRASETVEFITGVKAMPAAEDAEEAFVPPPKPEAEVSAKEPKAPKAPKPAPAVEDDDDDLPTEPKMKVKVEQTEKPKAAEPVAVADDLDDLDFDD